MTELAPIARYTEPEAAKQLGCSLITLKRERRRGNIEYTLIGVRSIKYTQQQIDAYIEKRRRCNGEKTEPCEKGHLEAAPASPKSETSGCRSTAPRRASGASRGTTRRLARLEGVAQASRILRAQK
jgi:hypothetical protein